MTSHLFADLTHPTTHQHQSTPVASPHPHPTPDTSALASLPPSESESESVRSAASATHLTISALVNMLHHSSSRHQRNRGSRIKTLLQVTLLVGVVVWLLYQVKHSYDKKNEYLDDTEDQLAHDDRSVFQGRKERVGSYGDGNVEKVAENSDVISKPEEDKSGETVFEKENIDSHEDDARNTERSEAEEGQASGANGNTEAHTNDEDETTGHLEADKHDAESNSSDAESKSEVRSTGDDVPQNNHAQEESTGETNGTPHEEVAQGDESTNADQSNASSNGSVGEEAEKKEAVDSQTNSGSLSDDTKTGTSDEHGTETLPDETGNVPSVHNENPLNDANENQGDAASTTSDASEHSTSGTVHIETGSEHEGTTSSGTASGDDEKGAEMVTANEVSDFKEANSAEGNAATEVSNDQAANTETENSQGVSAAEVANGSSAETKSVENQSDGAAETSNNGEQEDIKIETSTSTNDEHNESQGGDGSSGSNGSNDSAPEQTGKTETQ